MGRTHVKAANFRLFRSCGLGASYAHATPCDPNAARETDTGEAIETPAVLSQHSTAQQLHASLLTSLHFCSVNRNPFPNNN
jgi:hypothetical protein